MDAYSVPGAAQVSLAKLGDSAFLHELEKELRRAHGDSIYKLQLVGTPDAISVLMAYLGEHISDASLSRNYGDYTVDTRNDVVQAVERMLPNPPRFPVGTAKPSYYEAWLSWWNENKAKPVTLSISKDVQNPHLRCLARKVEWGFPDAILDIAHVKDPQVMPILRVLAGVGNQAFTLNTISGRARFALAELGDEDDFNLIVEGLNTAGYPTSIEELRIIGGKKAVGALIDALDGAHFLPEHQGYGKLYAKELADREKDLVSNLAMMVISPPESDFTPKSAKRWREWWAENKDTARFVRVPITIYE